MALSTKFYEGPVSIYNVKCLLEGNTLAQTQHLMTGRGKLFQLSYQNLCCWRIISTSQILAFSDTKLSVLDNSLTSSRIDVNSLEFFSLIFQERSRKLIHQM